MERDFEELQIMVLYAMHHSLSYSQTSSLSEEGPLLPPLLPPLPLPHPHPLETLVITSPGSSLVKGLLLLDLLFFLWPVAVC